MCAGHDVELPAGDGHPQDRPCHRRRLHHGVQPRQPPLSSLALVDILVEVGLPAGVLNVVPTSKASAVVSPWVSSGIARKVNFT